MKSLEHNAQKALFTWASLASGKYPELDLLFAIPNGGHRHIRVASKLKAEGVMAGVPDIFLPVARGNYHGLFIEMKSEKGKISEIQKLWITNLKIKNYKVEICYGFNEAKNILENYINLLPL